MLWRLPPISHENHCRKNFLFFVDFFLDIRNDRSYIGITLLTLVLDATLQKPSAFMRRRMAGRGLPAHRFPGPPADARPVPRSGLETPGKGPLKLPSPVHGIVTQSWVVCDRLNR
jgi:hypothetical protein